MTVHNIKTRVVSALIAVIILISVIYFFKENGMLILGVAIVFKGILEQSKLYFLNVPDKKLKILFIVTSFSGFLYTLFSPFERGLSISTSIAFVLSNMSGIVMHKKFKSISDLQIFSSQFMAGFIYSAIMPAIILGLLKIPNGLYWFFCLLVVVFSGDIGAYLFGTLWGKRKIAPLLSPKKSIEGSVGGLLFSTLAGAGFSFIIPDTPILIMIFVGFIGGLLGQVGDFYESLMKRIAGVKDSGSIMPGHGGVLDRLDGLYFASPLFYIVINYIIK